MLPADQTPGLPKETAPKKENMSKLETVTKGLKEKGEKSLVIYLTAGYPDMDTFIELIHAASSAGCDVIEIGVPFSDPIADGPVIQQASEQALGAGVSLTKVIDVSWRVTSTVKMPLVLMSYINPIIRFGLERFSRLISSAGISGMILPDVPYEESSSFRKSITNGGVTYIDFIAPTSGRERIKRVAAGASGFIYLISVTGVTGARSGVPKGLDSIANAIRATSNTPVYLGFGISEPKQAKEASRFSDGVIVGSAIIEKIMHSPSKRKAVEVMSRFVSDVKEAINS